MIRIAGRRQACIHKVKKNGQGRPIERDRGYMGPTSCGAGVDQVRLTKTTGVFPPFPLKSIFYPLLFLAPLPFFVQVGATGSPNGRTEARVGGFLQGKKNKVAISCGLSVGPSWVPSVR
ncbi:hypothetical protein GW17_00007606 [Ensete ventricosum]|nr:hypothetical protein GW17_00007606 [Ensete ventricosum]